MKGLYETHFNFDVNQNFYKGKVRDVYRVKDKMIMIASDRISAFDVILPRTIPYKGQVLNQIAIHFLEATSDICPNWFESSPDVNVSIGKICEPIRIEMVVRGYLAGHAWRLYKSGIREICGVELVEGLYENDKLPFPIITPATKAEEGHDEDISKQQILKSEIVSQEVYSQMENIALQLFQRGTEMAQKQGLILVDTKYEFGFFGGELMLMDEIHTPDSSRYFEREPYEFLQMKGLPQKHLSKEFVREWLIEQDFMGKEGQVIPEMDDEIVSNVSKRYIDLFQQLTGQNFTPRSYENLESTLYDTISKEISI